MTCKDCIHFELCGVFDYISPAECGFFTDRSRFVELPCKIGERLFLIIPAKQLIIEYVIIEIETRETGMIYKAVDTLFYTMAGFLANDIGTIVFLAREEAEQALKERESNDKTDH